MKTTTFVSVVLVHRPSARLPWDWEGFFFDKEDYQFRVNGVRSFRTAKEVRKNARDVAKMLGAKCHIEKKYT